VTVTQRFEFLHRTILRDQSNNLTTPWGSLARRRHGHLHVGRVNSACRIRICAASGADSFDGSDVSRYTPV
jgi:hypothetical protein